MTAVLLFAAALAAPPFSHKLHLNLGLECAGCHPRAASSTQAADNLLPARAACLKCHEDPAVPAPRPHTVSRFNHQLHLKMGNLAPVIAKAIESGKYLGPPPKQVAAKDACGACHRGMEQSDAIAGKSALPQMADCLVCHDRIEPPFSCEKCHDHVPKLVPASHTPDWVDRHTGVKYDKQTCAVCHGRRFTCQGCH